jgi:hypothetical protein
VKRNSLIAAATLTLLMTSAADAAQSSAQEEILMPEIAVTGQAAARQHPQDGNYSERPLGCVETVTPRGTGNETGGYFQARNAREGIPVIPSLNNPSSANETYRRGPSYYQHPATPAGQEGKPGCAR